MQARPTLLALTLLAGLFTAGPASSAPCSPPPAGLVHHWPADGNAFDAIGDLHGQTDVGPGYDTGVAGKCFRFAIGSRAVDQLQLGGAPLPPPWTIAAWIRREDSPDASAALFADAATAIKLEQYGTDQRVGFTQFGVTDYFFDATVTAGTWVHVALTANENGTTLYLDGEPRGTLPNVVNLPLAYLGGPADDRLKGQVDELMVFNRDLSAAEIRDVTRWTAMPCDPELRQSNFPADDVLGAFLSLTPNGEPLAFRPSPDAPIAYGITLNDPFGDTGRKSHYQGIQRWDGPGGPFVFVSRAGYDVDAGNLVVVKLGSRNGNGERLRSNRLQTDQGINDTRPPASDRIVYNRYFAHRHIGSMQLVGDILAVALEDPRASSDLPTGRVMFFNVTDPTAPVALNYTLDIPSHNVGVIGMTRLPDGHFLLLVTWGNNDRMEFYRSNQTSFLDPDFAFELHDDFFAIETQGGFMPVGGDTEPAYQSLSLVNQADGAIFMIGARNGSVASPIVNGEDLVAAYEIRGWEAGHSISVIKRTSEQHKFCTSNTDAGGTPIRNATKSMNASFAAGSGTYVSPTGELLFYATEHWNDGVNLCVRFVEFHHRDVVRPNSPLQAPQARLTGPRALGEGSSLVLDGRASRGAELRPWIELYDDDQFTGTSVMMDYDDRLADDFQDFRKLNWNDKASSLRYFAPAGWVIMLHDADNFSVSDTEPVLALPGDGAVHEISNLSADPWKFDNQGLHETRVTSVRFIAPPANPFGGPLQFLWSIDPRFSNRVTFDNADTAQPKLTALDGPAVVPIRLTVRQTINGIVRSNTTDVLISISNQPPVFDVVELLPRNAPGRVTGNVQFIDPSPVETHTLTIDWGDGQQTALPGDAARRRFTEDHVYANDNPSQPAAETFVVTFTLSEDGGESVTTKRNYTAVWRNNAPPVFGDTATVVAPGAAGSMSLVVPFTDADPTDTHTLQVSWGDSTSENVVLGSGEPSVFRLVHQYAAEPSASCPERSTFNISLRLIDNGGTAADASVEHLVVWAGGTAEPNAPGLALKLVGSQTAINVPANPAFNAFPMTVATWFSTTQEVDFAVLLNHYADHFTGWSFYVESGHLRAWYFRDARNYIWDDRSTFDAGFVADGQWHFAAFTVDESGGHIFVDGKLRATKPWTGQPGPCTEPGGIDIGSFPGNLESGSGELIGQLDEATLWSRALSLREVQRLALQFPVSDAPGLVAHWPMNEGSGQLLLDKSATGHGAASIQGDAGWTNSMIWRNPTTQGPGYALRFQGNGSAEVGPGPQALNLFPLTVMGWFKTCQSEQTSLINKYVAGSLNGYQLFLVDGHIRAWYFRSPTSYVWDGGNGLDGGPVNDGRWHHAALVVDQSGGRLYLDGELRQALPWSGTSGQAGPTTATEPVRFGVYPGGAPVAVPYVGRLENVSIWSIALSPEQIQTNRFRLFPGNTPGLAISFNFDEGRARVAKGAGLIPAAATLSAEVAWELSDAPVGAASVAPVLNVPTVDNDRSLAWSALGLPGFGFVLQTSTDLAHWTTSGLATESTPGVFRWPATNSPDDAREFHRLTSP